MERSWIFVIAGREVEVTSQRKGDYYAATMNQGQATFAAPLTNSAAAGFVGALNLDASEVCGLPMQVVSTGLPYLIVPVTHGGLSAAGIVVDDFEGRLATVDAKFVYVLDPERREGRTWNNSGATEDIATGSAAGPAAAYLLEHHLADPREEIVLQQGRFVGRRSTMSITAGADADLWVGGPVAPVASGRLDSANPERAKGGPTSCCRPALSPSVSCLLSTRATGSRATQAPGFPELPRPRAASLHTLVAVTPVSGRVCRLCQIL